MPYCTIDDVNSGGFLKFDLTNTATLINKQPAPDVITNQIIPDVDARIDDTLRQYFVVPVDPTNCPLSTKTLNRIAKWYVAAEIASRIYLQQGTSDSQQAQTWRQLADADLSKCLSVGNYLADAVKSNDSPDVKSDLISDTISANGWEPKFSWNKTRRF